MTKSFLSPTSAFLAILSISFVLVCFAFSTPAGAAQTIPYKMNFQGRLTTSAGVPKADGTYNMKFSIYDASSGGALVWSEERSVYGASGVVLVGGLFSTQLGDVTGLTPSAFTDPDLYFEIELPTPATATCATAACAVYSEGAMTPRNKLASAAYAFNADTVDGIDGANLGQLNGNNVWTGTNQVKLNSATAFNVQNASSVDAFNVDTSTSQITLGVDTTLAAGKSLTITGSGTRPASPTEGMIYYDTTTKQLLQYNGTKWVSDRSTATKIVAASNSSQAIKDSADYVADGTDDQVQINAALTAAAGGKVYLAEGTYTTHRTANGNATILIPNNTTLAGAGRGTLVQLGNIDVTDNLIEATDTNRTGVVIQDLRIDGQKSLNTAGTQHGVYLSGMGSGDDGNARQGSVINNVWVDNFRTDGIYYTASSNNKLLNTTVQANGRHGVQIESSYNNTITSNKVQGSGEHGITIAYGARNTVTGNLLQNNLRGIYLEDGDNNTISGNITRNSTQVGISFYLSDNNTVTGNNSQDNSLEGIVLDTSHNNIVSGNKVANNGGAESNYGMTLNASDANTVTNNNITDDSATANNYAININDSTSDNNYLADNRFSSTPATSTIRDLGTGTVYSSQPLAENGGKLTTRTAADVASFQIQNAAGLGLLTTDTTNGEVELGSSTLAGKLVVSDGSSNTVTLSVNALAGDYTLAIPTITANDTLCLLILGNCGVDAIGTLDGGTANATGATIASNTLYLQSASATYSGLVNTTTQTLAGDKTFTGNTALNGNTIIAADKYLKITGSGTRPGTPTEGMIYYDTTTKQLLTYANGKWQGDSKTATFVVAAPNSSQAAKDSAQYVANGEDSSGSGIGTLDGDQIEINQALTAAAAAGGNVYLAEGTYTVDAAVSIPNNVTLAGSGNSTLIQLGNFGATTVNINAIANTDQTTGTGVVIRDIKTDGRKSLNTAGTQRGVYLNNMGGGTGVTFRKGANVTDVTANNFAHYGFQVTNNASYNTLIGNTAQGNNDTGFMVNTSANSNALQGNIAKDNAVVGFYLIGSSYNTLTNNFAQSNGNGFRLSTSANNNTLTGNTAQGSTTNGFILTTSSSYNTLAGNTSHDSANYGFGLNSANYNTLTGNTSSGTSAYGFALLTATNNTVSGNTVNDPTTFGINLVTSSDNNTISTNRIYNSGGGTTNFAIVINDSDSNYIESNNITDTAASSTNSAIYIYNLASNNYLTANLFSSTLGTSTINNAGTGTVYANQSLAENGAKLMTRTAADVASFQIQNAAGLGLLTTDTTNGEVELGSSTLAGKLVVSDGSSNTVTLSVNALAGNYTLAIPTITANDTLCLLTLGNCGVNAIGTLDGGTANATGATITSNTLYLQSASATYSGLVNITTQTFAGAKTFSGSLTGSLGLTVTGATTSLNTSSNFATNINTGTSTGAVNIGSSTTGAIALQSATTIGLTATTTINGLAAGAGTALTVNNSTSTGSVFVAQDGGTAVMTIADGGAITAKNTTNSTAAYQIQNTSSVALFTVDTTNARLYVGPTAGDTVGTLLVVGNKTNAGDPTGVEGAMYYNSSTKDFRCYENGSWRNCTANGYETMEIKDEFIGSIFDGQVEELDYERHVGELGWMCDSDLYSPGVNNLTGCQINTSSEFDDHPGIVEIITIDNTTNLVAGIWLQPVSLNKFDRLTYIIKTSSTATTQATYRVGLCDDGCATGQPVGGVYFNYIGGNWKAVTRAANTETSTDTGVTLANSTWYRLEIKKSGSNYIFYINGTQVASQSTNVSTAVQQPMAILKNRTANYTSLRVDYFSMRTTALSR